MAEQVFKIFEILKELAEFVDPVFENFGIDFLLLQVHQVGEYNLENHHLAGL